MPDYECHFLFHRQCDCAQAVSMHLLWVGAASQLAKRRPNIDAGVGRMELFKACITQGCVPTFIAASPQVTGLCAHLSSALSGLSGLFPTDMLAYTQ